MLKTKVVQQFHFEEVDNEQGHSRQASIDQKSEIDERWTVKRSRTFFVFLFHYMSHGLEYTIIKSTLWRHLSDDVNGYRAEMFYSLINGSNYLPILLFGVVISKYFDLHRRLKMCTMIMSLLVSIGYVLYIVPSSPYFQMSGIFLQGFNLPFSTIANSEILRVYDDTVIPKKLLLTMIAYSVGDVIGPICVKVTENVDFWIGELHVSYWNVPSLILIAISFAKILLIHFLLHDLSKEFDLKASKSYAACSKRTDNSWLNTLKRTFGWDALLLLAVTFYGGFYASLIPCLFSVIIQTLRYDKLFTILCFIGASVMMISISLTIRRISPQNKGLYNCGILCLFSLLLTQIMMVLLSRGFNKAINCALLAVLVLCYAFSFVAENTFTIAVLGKLFISSNQSFAENVRKTTSLCGQMTASYTSGYVYTYFLYIFPASAIVFLLLIIGIISRRKTLSEPHLMPIREHGRSHSENIETMDLKEGRVRSSYGSNKQTIHHNC